MPKQIKINTVSSVKAKLEASKSVIISDYRGISVADMTILRKRLREQGAELKVVKNRLAKIALKDAGLQPMDSYLKGTTAITFGLQDPVSAAKILMEYAKENDKLKVIGGQMDNRLLSAGEIAELAKMPSREVLLSRLLGSITSPVQKLAYGLHQTVAKVVYAVDAVARQKAEQ